MHMLCLLSLKFLNNKEESMEKRKGVSKLIVAILLLMILMIYIVTSVELYKAGEPERVRQHYNQLIKDPPHNCAQPRHIIPADPNFEKKRNSSALFAREINLVTQPSFDCEQGINSQVQTACSNADAIFPFLGIVSCRNERFSLSRKTHVPLWTAPRISHVRLP